MAAQFVVTRNGRDSFCSEDELRKMATRGLLSPGDLVYHPVLGRWLYAREVEEIRAEMTAAASLGRPQAPGAPMDMNGEAVAGFVLGMLGLLPLVGLVACLLGLVFSTKGLKRAALLENRGHGLAVAGMVLSIIYLVPQAACSAGVLSSWF